MALWTPTEITTAIWLDAADEGTVSLDAGRVSGWADKSGNSRHAIQDTPASRPLYDVDILGDKLIDFFGGNYGLSFTGGTIAAKDFFAVCTFSGQDSGVIFSIQGPGDPWIIRDRIGCTSGDPTNFSATYKGMWPFVAADNLDTGKTIFNYYPSNGNIDVVLFQNAVAVELDPGFGTEHTPVDYDTFYVGYDGGSGGWFVHQIYEIVVCPDTLLLTDRQKMEGYLAHKWGLDLPSGHPHKDNAPGSGGQNFWTSFIGTTEVAP